MRKNLIVTLIFTVCAILLYGQTAVQPVVGDGSSEYPFEITSWENLYWISQSSDNWDKHYLQTADIDFTLAVPEITTWNENTGWNPIGNIGASFTGTYNGNGKTVSGLYINRAADYQGLFGYISQAGSKVENLGVINASIAGSNSTGILAGSIFINTIINNCYSTGSVTGNGNVGGLVGLVEFHSQINNSYSTGSVNGNSQVGGLIGHIYFNSQINNSYSTGSVNGSENVGGLVGYSAMSTVSNSFWDVQSSGQTGSAGGTDKTSAEMKKLFTFTNAGWLFPPSENPVWHIDESLSAPANNGYPTLAWQDLTHHRISPFLQDPGQANSSANPYLIANWENLYWISQNPDYWNKHYLQTADIDFTLAVPEITTWNENTGWNPIGNIGASFTGTYNGNGKTVSGLYINRAADYQGLFGYISQAGSKVENLGVINASIAGSIYTGILAGYISNNSIINNCYSTGSVNGNANVGGLVGYTINSSQINNSYSTGSVNGSWLLGGLVGYTTSSSQINNSYSTGSVNGSNFVGGLTGSVSNSQINNSYSTGSVNGSENVGGLVGYSAMSTVSNSFWDVQSSGQTGSAGGTDKTSAEMKKLFTFTNAGWLFPPSENPVWHIDESLSAPANNGYPTLAWQDLTHHRISPFLQDPGQANSSANPYLIANWENLYWISQNPDYWNKHYLQTADIDFTLAVPEITTWNENTGWNPIGNIGASFTGTYNGNGKTVSGLYINRAADYQGLFGYISQAGSKVENLGVINASITGASYTGILAGAISQNSVINNCYSTGSVTGSDYIGGLVGDVFAYSQINNSYSTGTVTGTNFVGGLVGRANTHSQINNSYSTGSVTGSCFVGGLVGRVHTTQTNYSYSTGSVEGNGNVGGLAGHSYASTVSNSFWDIQTSGQTESAGGTGKTSAEMKNLLTFTNAGWLFPPSENPVWHIDESLSAPANNGYPTLAWQDLTHHRISPFLQDPGQANSSANPYLIANWENLYWISQNPDYWDKHYLQTADIDFADAVPAITTWNENTGWSPIGNTGTNFTGTYNGNSKTVSGLYINRNTNYQGLFGFISQAGSKVENLGVINASIAGTNYTGILAGCISSFSIVYSSYSTGSVTGSEDVGGLVGRVFYSQINNCYSTGSVNGSWNVGGLAGNNHFYSQINNSYSTGSVNGSSNVGGLAGSANAYSQINNSYSTGSVTGSDYIGGLVGYIHFHSQINNSYSTGSVTGSDYVGGLVGNSSGSTVSNSFWDVQSSGQTGSAGGTGKTSAEMKDITIYLNTVPAWDICEGFNTDYIWNIQPGFNSDYPFLSEVNYFSDVQKVENFSLHLINTRNVTLVWNPPVSDDTPYAYFVYRDGVLVGRGVLSNSASFNQILSDDGFSVNTDDDIYLYFTDTVSEYGSYLYEVSAVYDYYGENNYRESAREQTEALVELYPSVNKLYHRFNGNHVLLYWENPWNNDEAVYELSGFNLYRKVGINGQYVLLNTDRLLSSGAGDMAVITDGINRLNREYLTFIDSQAPTGDLYYLVEVIYTAEQSAHKVQYVNKDTYYKTVWTNNGYFHMNFYVTEAFIAGAGLEAGDEIAVYNTVTYINDFRNISTPAGMNKEDKRTLNNRSERLNTYQWCVGTVLVPEGADGFGFNLHIPASLAEGNFTYYHEISSYYAFDGYITGDTEEFSNSKISFKVFKKNQGRNNGIEYEDLAAYIFDNDGNKVDRFTPGNTAFVRLGSLILHQQTTLNHGWNIVSSRVVPELTTIPAIFAELKDSGALMRVIAQGGNSYDLINNWNNEIGNLKPNQSYRVRVNTPSNFNISGISVFYDQYLNETDIDWWEFYNSLNPGWNLISYPYNVQINPLPLLAENDLLKQVNHDGVLTWTGPILKIMDQHGNSIQPVINNTQLINTIGSFKPGQGYIVYVDPETTTDPAIKLVYPLDHGHLHHRSQETETAVLNPSYFQKNWSGNGWMHFNLVVAVDDFVISSLSAGDEIALFDGDNCVAVTVYNGQTDFILLAASLDENPDGVVNGYNPGNEYSIKIWFADSQSEISVTSYNIIQGSNIFEVNGTSVICFSDFTSDGNLITPAKSEISAIYPNPFNPETNIRFSTRLAGKVNLEIYNVKGQKVNTLVSGHHEAGFYQVTWNGVDNNGRKVGSGVYFTRLTTPDKQVVKKMVLIK